MFPHSKTSAKQRSKINPLSANTFSDGIFVKLIGR